MRKILPMIIAGTLLLASCEADHKETEQETVITKTGVEETTTTESEVTVEESADIDAPDDLEDIDDNDDIDDIDDLDEEGPVEIRSADDVLNSLQEITGANLVTADEFQKVAEENEERLENSEEVFLANPDLPNYVYMIEGEELEEFLTVDVNPRQIDAFSWVEDSVAMIHYCTEPTISYLGGEDYHIFVFEDEEGAQKVFDAYMEDRIDDGLDLSKPTKDEYGKKFFILDMDYDEEYYAMYKNEYGDMTGEMIDEILNEKRDRCGKYRQVVAVYAKDNLFIEYTFWINIEDCEPKAKEHLVSLGLKDPFGVKNSGLVMLSAESELDFYLGMY